MTEYLAYYKGPMFNPQYKEKKCWINRRHTTSNRVKALTHLTTHQSMTPKVPLKASVLSHALCVLHVWINVSHMHYFNKCFTN